MPAKTLPAKKVVLVLDLGTTGVKAFVFDAFLNPLSRVYYSLKKSFPQKGWVEQNPVELVKTAQKALKQAVRQSGLAAKDFLGLGITNQRETTILWHKKTGQPVYPAIVWEDERTKSFCQSLAKEFGLVARRKTGLTIDSYFSASKIRWILENIPAAKKLASRQHLFFGTPDTWLLWNFTGKHFTDYTNASRTLLFNIRTLRWDKELLKIFQIPENILPQVKPSAAFYGSVKKEVLGFSLPILALGGDQQASLYAALNGSTGLGQTKITYGTGTFIMQVIGRKFQLKEPFFTTLTALGGQTAYALEAKIACCGKKVEKELNQPAKLNEILADLGQKVDYYLKKLPYRPKKVMIDGGVTRCPALAKIQAEISKVTIVKQKIPDGTALGIAKLIFDNKKYDAH